MNWEGNGTAIAKAFSSAPGNILPPSLVEPDEAPVIGAYFVLFSCLISCYIYFEKILAPLLMKFL